MKISKEFRWEMGHRLPHHNGLCRNVHGHSYRMIVEVTGDVDDNGMVIDFFDLNNLIEPILEKYDHAFLCWENDNAVRDFLKKEKMKTVVVSYQSTVENICNDLLDQIHKEMKNTNNNNIKGLTIKIYETPNAFAEQAIEF
jgi:6-pyruvoyltetrahydropterin/6-carboxytetrahydropterin synthase